MSTKAPSESRPIADTPQWLQALLLLAPAGVWLALLLVIPTLLIFELSLVPNIKPGDLVNPSGLDN
ncbi:MAG: ABC transporter permease, partial [Phormidesmis sp. CAN_BIN44]|nr:ABC transporter permease [Phormidesmis sp. CAN_BIN44]